MMRRIPDPEDKKDTAVNVCPKGDIDIKFSRQQWQTLCILLHNLSMNVFDDPIKLSPISPEDLAELDGMREVIYSELEWSSKPRFKLSGMLWDLSESHVLDDVMSRARLAGVTFTIVGMDSKGFDIVEISGVEIRVRQFAKEFGFDPDEYREVGNK